MIALILDNIRSTHNVGSIFRSADGFAVAHIFIAGYTPYPRMKNDLRLPHQITKVHQQIAKTALGAEDTVPFSVHGSVAQVIEEVHRQGYFVVALEQDAASQSLNTFTPRPKTAILVGNEINGIESSTLELTDSTIEIPMLGKKESFNVAVATAVALYAARYNR